VQVKETGQYFLEVRSGGAWEMTVDGMFIVNLDPAEQSPSYSGEGDTAIKIKIGKTGVTKFNFQHSGQKNFAVDLINAKSYTIYSIANTTTKTLEEHSELLTEGDYFMRVKAEGKWLIELK
jgi:hypothetical protein